MPRWIFFCPGEKFLNWTRNNISQKVKRPVAQTIVPLRKTSESPNLYRICGIVDANAVYYPAYAG